jgi:MFS family permease
MMLGSLEWVTDLQSFLFISFIAQTSGGLGCGMNNTAVMAMLSGLRNEDREKSIGYLEVSNGIGILTGPLIGAL